MYNNVVITTNKSTYINTQAKPKKDIKLTKSVKTITGRYVPSMFRKCPKSIDSILIERCNHLSMYSFIGQTQTQK